MQFIVVLQPKAQFAAGGAPADIAEVELSEQLQTKALYKSGVVRQVWAIDTDRKGAIGLFEAATDDELRAALNSLPMVQKDYVDQAVYPVGAFTGFIQ